MIAACPKCTARYRVDETRIGPNGARLKCAKCETLFRVAAPVAPAVEPVAPPAQPAVAQPSAPVEQSAAAVAQPPAPVAPAAPPAVQPSPAVSQQSMGAEAPVQQRSPDAGVTGSTDEGPVVDRDRLVIVADPDVEAGKSTVAKLFAWGLHPILVHDGVEAMLTIQRMLPRVVVLDAALPKMYGFQVCEVIKRNESLRHTGVVLVGAIHNQDRYRRQPAELYGADYYIEQPDLPEGLEPLFVQMGVTLSAPGTNATPAPPPTPEPAAPPAFQPPPEQSSLELPPEQPSLELPPEQPSFETAIEPAEVAAPVQAPPAQAQPSVDPVDELAEERAKAERLARIIVSDIALYQPEKFGQAVASGKVIEVMDSQIEEGRVLFAQRVDERVRAERDFIVDELLRVARERGMQ